MKRIFVSSFFSVLFLLVLPTHGSQFSFFMLWTRFISLKFLNLRLRRIFPPPPLISRLLIHYQFFFIAISKGGSRIFFTYVQNSNKNTGGKVVKYGFGNLFDFDYLIRYLRTSRNKVTTNLGVSLYTSKLMSIVDTWLPGRSNTSKRSEDIWYHE